MKQFVNFIAMVYPLPGIIKAANELYAVKLNKENG